MGKYRYTKQAVTCPGNRCVYYSLRTSTLLRLLLYMYASPFLYRISMKPFSISNRLNCAAVYFFPCIFNRSVKVYALRTILHLFSSFAGDGVIFSMFGRFMDWLVFSVGTGISIIGKPCSSAIFFISSNVAALSAPPNLCKAPTHSISSCTV